MRNPNTRLVVYLLGHDCVPIVAHAVILPLGGIAEALAREREGGRQSGGQRHADQGSACHGVIVETLQPTSLGLLL